MYSCQTFKKIAAFAETKGLPLIPINGADLAIIEEPKSFFQTILNQIRRCKHRICLSSLYLGVNKNEKDLIETIYNQLDNEASLRVDIALDANRARRPDANGQSSLSVLSKLNSFDSRITINLIETRRKNLINGLISRIPRWNEIVSTYHSKFLVFDDNIILTGANLSSVYFDLRKDRYLLLKNSPLLANYLSDSLLTTTTRLAAIRDHIYGVNKKYVEHIHDLQLNASDTYAMPLSQFGSLGMNDKEDFIVFLDSIKTKDARLFLSSGYFNPSPKMSSILIDSALVASEGANNFGTGQGLMKYIPKLYSALYKDYLDRHHECQMKLYNKKDWSFHAKGLWLENLDDIYIHIIGSSNYNNRSSFRDFESQIVILTRNKKLIKCLQEERRALWFDSCSVRDEHFLDLNPLHRFFARLFRSYL